MPNTVTNNKYAILLAFFVTTVIPFTAWFGGFIPPVAFAADLQKLDQKQTGMQIQFYQSEIREQNSRSRNIQREQWQYTSQGQQVPAFFDEEKVDVDARIDELETKLQDAKQHKLGLDSLEQQ